MKQTSNMRQQPTISLRYCYSARRGAQNMLASHIWLTVCPLGI